MANNVGIEDIRNLGNISLTNNWKLDLRVVGDKARAAIGKLGVVNVRCVSTGAPTKSINPVDVTIRGHVVGRPGDLVYNRTFDFVLVGIEDNSVEEFVRDYYEVCCSWEHLAQYKKAEIECTAVFTRLNSMNEPIYEYELVGAWLSNATFPGGESTASAMNISCTLSFDYFKERTIKSEK